MNTDHTGSRAAALLRTHAPKVLLLGAVLSLVAVVAVQLLDRANPNPRPVAYLGAGGIPQVMLQSNSVDQYVTAGSINGLPVRFLIDTGAADVAMSQRMAQQLNLTLKSGGLSKTGNGVIASWSARLDQVEVGGLAVHDVRATVLPNLGGQEVLLGMAYLKHFDVRLADGRLWLRPLTDATLLSDR